MASPTLHILNAGASQARGMGVTLGRRFGDARERPGHLHLRPRLARRAARRRGDARPIPLVAFREGRLPRPGGARRDRDRRDRHAAGGALPAQPAASGRRAAQRSNARRFDVQLSQGLPFLGALTRADWDVLFASGTSTTRPARAPSWTSTRYRTRRSGCWEASRSVSDAAYGPRGRASHVRAAGEARKPRLFLASISRSNAIGSSDSTRWIHPTSTRPTIASICSDLRCARGSRR